MSEPCVSKLMALFDECFKPRFNTVLVRGDDEPIYLPADEQNPHHRVIFAHGFFASALHEIAHWCVAGAARRERVDFGYWYKPDGRTADEQAEFEQVEVKPQALEWIFSQSAGLKFNFSADNLSSDIGASPAFKQRVWQQVQDYLNNGLPERPQILVQTLTAGFGQPLPRPEHFSLEGK